jgi:hypothetical protein
MRKALEVVDVYRKAGLLFVAMPVLDTSDHEILKLQSQHRLEQIIGAAEQEQPQ